ncbi:hypothetical protein A9Q86_01140 [Flavobacteriales bacterium 33_180_T64]|nr:hypothetical protein A9Q86_01140 [Flavobacteriales bacterium 33_180_T64]
MNNKTAILIFANSAQLEAVQKPFHSSEVLFDALNDQTLKIAKRSGLPYFLSSEKNQKGASFGERFTNAIQSVYEKGFHNVIAIGNDTPHLQTQHILKAANRLLQNDIVLGPSKDGGFYLIGIKHTHFNIENFLKLPWQTSRLNQSISKLVTSKKSSITYLEGLNDINSVSDAKAIINSFRNVSKQIKQLLQLYISVEQKTDYNPNHLIPIFNRDTYFNKGSPFLV